MRITSSTAAATNSSQLSEEKKKDVSESGAKNEQLNPETEFSNSGFKNALANNPGAYSHQETIVDTTTPSISDGESYSAVNGPDSPESTSRSSGPDETEESGPVEGPTSVDAIDPPYENNQIIEMDSGNYYKVVDRTFEKWDDDPGVWNYEVERVEKNIDGSYSTFKAEFEPQASRYSVKEGQSYPTDINMSLTFDGETGNLQSATMSFWPQVSGAGGFYVATLGPDTGYQPTTDSSFFDMSAIDAQENLTQDLREFFEDNLPLKYEGDPVGPHPDDIDIGPNAEPPTGIASSGSSGGATAGSGATDGGGIAGAGDFGQPEGSKGYGDGTGEGAGPRDLPPPTPIPPAA